MQVLPPEFAITSIGTIQFASTAGYLSVAGLLLGSILPSSSRSIFAGIILTMETLSALSQGYFYLGLPPVTDFIFSHFGFVPTGPKAKVQTGELSTAK